LRLESACIIGVGSDILFPLHQQYELAAALQDNGIDTRMIDLPSEQGHDSFLVDYARFNPAVSGYFSKILESEKGRSGFPK
jgi:homoserine O-acetyltransferase